MSYSTDALSSMTMYVIASSSLLLVNKVCMHRVPLPAAVSTLQFLVTGGFVALLKATRSAEVDGWEWEKVKPYLLYGPLFCATIYTNMMALSLSNVETVIVARACSPLAVSVLDWSFLGRELPSRRSLLALLGISGGAVSYVLSDRTFKFGSSYYWVSAYFFIVSIEMAYGKFIVGSHLGFKSMWGPTLYTNVLGSIPMGLGSLVSGELAQLRTMTLSPNTFAVLALSCVIGVLISYSGFRCRSAVSATCFTVLGVGCKFATVLANVLLWDKHASLQGITCLVLTLMTASLYSQAPMRSERDSKPVRQVLTIAALALTSGGAVTVGYKMAAPSAVVQAPQAPPDAAAPAKLPLRDPVLAPQRHRPGIGNHSGTHHAQIADSLLDPRKPRRVHPHNHSNPGPALTQSRTAPAPMAAHSRSVVRRQVNRSASE